MGTKSSISGSWELPWSARGYNIATAHVYFTCVGQADSRKAGQLASQQFFRGALSKLTRCKKIRTAQLNLSLNHTRYHALPMPQLRHCSTCGVISELGYPEQQITQVPVTHPTQSRPVLGKVDRKAQRRMSLHHVKLTGLGTKRTHSAFAFGANRGIQAITHGCPIVIAQPRKLAQRCSRRKLKRVATAVAVVWSWILERKPALLLFPNNNMTSMTSKSLCSTENL